MSRDDEWGSHIELVALADVVGVPKLVTTDSDDEEDFQVWIFPSEQHIDVKSYYLVIRVITTTVWKVILIGDTPVIQCLSILCASQQLQSLR